MRTGNDCRLVGSASLISLPASAPIGWSGACADVGVPMAGSDLLLLDLVDLRVELFAPRRE